MAKTSVSLPDVLAVTNRIEEKLDKMGERISDLELWRAGIKAQILVVTAVLSTVFTMVWDYARKKTNL